MRIILCISSFYLMFASTTSLASDVSSRVGIVVTSTAASTADGKGVPIAGKGLSTNVAKGAAVIDTQGPRIDLSQPDLTSQIDAVQKELKKGRIFIEISGPDRQQAQMLLTRFAEHGLKMEQSPSDTGGDVMPELLADQDKLNAILDKAQKDSVFICYAEKTTGSHFAVKKCRTVAQIRYLEEKARDTMRRRTEGLLDAPLPSVGGRALIE